IVLRSTQAKRPERTRSCRDCHTLEMVSWLTGAWPRTRVPARITAAPISTIRRTRESVFLKCVMFRHSAVPWGTKMKKKPSPDIRSAIATTAIQALFLSRVDTQVRNLKDNLDVLAFGCAKGHRDAAGLLSLLGDSLSKQE